MRPVGKSGIAGDPVRAGGDEDRATVERDSDHRYWIIRGSKRQEAVGVTRSLVEANLVDDTYFSDRVAGRGRLAHFFAHRVVTNTLNEPIPDSMTGYMVALRKFLDQYGPTIHNAEVIAGNPNRLLGGTIDLDVEIFGGDATIELKLSSPTLWHGLQLAPYSFLLEPTNWLRRGRFGLYLKPTGGFRIYEYDDPRDLDVFFRAHELLHWRISHGTNNRPYGKRTDHSDRAIVHDEGSNDGRSFDDGDPPIF